MSLDHLRSLARTVTPYALDIYDKEDTSSLLRLIAEVYEQPAGSGSRQNPVVFEWWDVFPDIKEWIGEREVDTAFKNSLSIKWGPYHKTYEFDKYAPSDPKTLLDLQKLASKCAKAFARGKVQLANRVLRRNPIAYDGQSLFDTNHVHPNGAPYSNLLSAPWGFFSTISVNQARDVLELGKMTLLE